MLTNTFIHLPGIDSETEDLLWSRGVTTWDLIELDDEFGRKTAVREAVAESRERLAARDAAYFAKRMPSHESWRLYSEFCAETAFLDIETTGLSGDAYTTVCGVLDRTGRARDDHAFEPARIPALLRTRCEQGQGDGAQGDEAPSH